MMVFEAVDEAGALNEDMPAMVGELTKRSVYGELLTPADVVPVIMFLLSDESRAITGSVLDVTNGFEA